MARRTSRNSLQPAQPSGSSPSGSSPPGRSRTCSENVGTDPSLEFGASVFSTYVNVIIPIDRLDVFSTTTGAATSMPTTRWFAVGSAGESEREAGLRAADEALYGRLTRIRSPRLDSFFANLSRAADYSALWLAVGGLLAALGGPRGRRAALHGLVSLGIASAVANGPLKLVLRRQRPPEIQPHRQPGNAGSLHPVHLHRGPAGRRLAPRSLLRPRTRRPSGHRGTLAQGEH